MDKLPKFRRKQKPRPPAIQTMLDHSSTDSVASNTNGAGGGGGGVALVQSSAEASPAQTLAPEKLPSRPSTSHYSRPQSTTRRDDGAQLLRPPSAGVPVGGGNSKARRRSPFRSLQKLRTSGKRGRGSPPAEMPSSPLTAPATVVSPDWHVSSPPRTAGQDDSRNGHSGPRIPDFLTLSEQDIDSKFREIQFGERERLFEAARNAHGPDNKYGHFIQPNVQTHGLMDRYVNIRPWNHNRIRLKVHENELDYVNASAITLDAVSDDSLPPLKYIAMQGPTEPSFPYVWRMIAENAKSPAVIIQLTPFYEGTSPKCHEYLPLNEEDEDWTLNEEDVWNDGWSAALKMESLEESGDGALQKRKLLLQVQGEDEPRIVWHLLYTRWSDFGTLNEGDVDGVFDLMKLSKELSNPDSPRIIHCSAGVGRTGTFISLEHLTRELEHGTLEHYDNPDSMIESPDLVFQTVDEIRDQRKQMVQGPNQYHFLYTVLRQLWQKKYGVSEGVDVEEPAAKRLEVGDGSDGEAGMDVDVDVDADAGDGPDVGGGGVEVNIHLAAD